MVLALGFEVCGAGFAPGGCPGVPTGSWAFTRMSAFSGAAQVHLAGTCAIKLGLNDPIWSHCYRYLYHAAWLSSGGPATAAVIMWI